MGEYAVEDVEEGGCQSANEEGVWEGLVEGLGEHTVRSLLGVSNIDQGIAVRTDLL